MTADITRLPPASRGKKPETERERRIRESVERPLPAWMIGEAGKKLIEMDDRWRCEAYSADDRKDLDDAPDGNVKGGSRTMWADLTCNGPM